MIWLGAKPLAYTNHLPSLVDDIKTSSRSLLFHFATADSFSGLVNTHSLKVSDALNNMKAYSLLVALAFAIISTVSAASSPFQTCPASHGVATAVRVTDCTIPPCFLKKGSSVNIEVDFIPSVAAKTLVDRVKGIIAGIRLPFSTDKPDGCDGKGIQCPLKAGEKYTFKSSIPISVLYPSLRLIVEWALTDETGGTVFCIQIPAQLTSGY